MAKTTKNEELDDFDPIEFEKEITRVEKKMTDEDIVIKTKRADMNINNTINTTRQKLIKQCKVKIRVSPSYKPYLGSKCQVLINGIPIIVPCDGSMVEVPAAYAAELYRRMAGIDDMISKQVRMSNYSENREQTIGAIKF
jgi:hypothetical protein